MLVAVWCAAIGAIHPVGDFPLLDDWDFAVATWNFASTGHFHFTQFTVVSLRAMVLWGAAWTHFFGRSFNVLRASTLVLSLATVLIVHRTLVYAGVTRFARLVAALAILFNPIFLWTSCTYMTDVPYVFASAVAFYLLYRGIGEDRFGFVVAGAIAVIVSWFVRQTGIVNIAPLLFMTFRTRRRNTAVGAAVVILFGLLFLFRRDWLSGSPDMFAVHYHVWNEESFRLQDQIALFLHYTIFNAQNCATFLIALTLPLLWRIRRSVALAAVAILVFWRVGDLALHGYWFPYSSHSLYSDILPGNLVFDGGIGPSELIDTFSLNYDYPFRMIAVARVLLTIVSAVVAALLLWFSVESFVRFEPSPNDVSTSRQRELLFRLAIVLAATGTLVLFASGYYYDRYSLDSAWSIVLALPLLVPWNRRGVKAVTVAALVATAIVSTLAVQECFIWNRARWEAWDVLRARGVPLDHIDGGGEAFALYELPNAPRAVARRGHPPREFAITLHPLKGYRVVERRPFESYLGMHDGVIYTLRKE